MEIERGRILEQLEKILKDKAFSRSKINRRLLRFLVHASLEGKEIKEVIIGTELFGSDYDPIKYDNKVRVYIYHLRKKLADYYENVAQEGELIFTIKKGQYQVEFSEWQKEPKARNHKKLYFIGFVALLILVPSILFFFRSEKNKFWNSLFQNQFSTTVLFSDFFTITGPTITGRSGAIRDLAINSTNELEAYLAENPEYATKLYASKHPYLSGHAPFCSKELSLFFFKNDYNFEVDLLRNWEEGNMQTENIVFFGPSKCMGMLEKILTDAYPQFIFEPQRVKRICEDTKDTIAYVDVVSFTDKIIDYTVVAKVSMPSGSQMNFFLSDQDCGAINAIQYFTNTDSTNSFYDRHEIGDRDFIALFATSGFDRKTYEMDFILVDIRE